MELYILLLRYRLWTYTVIKCHQGSSILKIRFKDRQIFWEMLFVPDATNMDLRLYCIFSTIDLS